VRHLRHLLRLYFRELGVRGDDADRRVLPGASVSRGFLPQEPSCVEQLAVCATGTRLMAAEPIPAFIGPPPLGRPPDLPTVAPAPAPTFPSLTDDSVAVSAAL
jgi:hypothetical protein